MRDSKAVLVASSNSFFLFGGGDLFGAGQCHAGGSAGDHRNLVINRTGMDQLCASAQVSKRTAYQHFTRKVCTDRPCRRRTAFGVVARSAAADVPSSCRRSRSLRQRRRDRHGRPPARRHQEVLCRSASITPPSGGGTAYPGDLTRIRVGAWHFITSTASRSVKSALGLGRRHTSGPRLLSVTSRSASTGANASADVASTPATVPPDQPCCRCDKQKHGNRRPCVYRVWHDTWIVRCGRPHKIKTCFPLS